MLFIFQPSLRSSSLFLVFFTAFGTCKKSIIESAPPGKNPEGNEVLEEDMEIVLLTGTS